MSKRASGVRVIRIGARRELTLLVGLGLAVMLAIGLGAAFASQRVAQTQALDDAERMTVRLANLVIKPGLPGYLEYDEAKADELRRALANRMSDGYLTEVTVWGADGMVLFSNKAEDVGNLVEPVPIEVQDAIAGRTTSDFEDDPPEADALPSAGAPAGVEEDRGPSRYVEVYTPLVMPGYPPMAFEAYYDYHRVEDVADRLLRQTLPLVLGPLLVLQAIQIPIAVSLARRLRRHQDERARLLERALSSSDAERVRFAADLHDGPIQDLAGIGYALGAVAPSVDPKHAPLMARVQEALQRSVQSLRTLMTDLYPPDLRDGNLVEALGALASNVRAEGLAVDLQLADVPELAEDQVTTLYRVVRESLANVVKHAQASTVTISLGPVAPDATDPQTARVRLVVADDGVGVDPSRLDKRAEGHLGLRLLADRVESLGGRLVVATGPDRGTSVEVELPVDSAARRGLPG
ncbi:Signal transduction histidine kinase [Friedmanniella luteola]|uniref:Oxygen sensor histidine kinase NreB n=1 Tax=Friedmanniella luteola TaxID=546871 RepID=A0A1H2AC80_9ACTN|nr:sensor histidine kinase [Friedmanniella luteola]SDT43477.1 Signal transduction histidine kinase [Friedmanniella luteola]